MFENKVENVIVLDSNRAFEITIMFCLNRVEFKIASI